MPYPPAILAMAQNLAMVEGLNADPHENEYSMIWNSILIHHFPLHDNYGVAPQISKAVTSKDPVIYTVAKVWPGRKEHIVLVAGFKKASEETKMGKESLKRILREIIEHLFETTEATKIYGLGGIGLCWTVFRLEKASFRVHEPEILIPWKSNITSARAFNDLSEVVDEMHDMAGT